MPVPDDLEIIFAVLCDRQARQFGKAEAVLQRFGNLVQQALGGRQRKILAAHRLPIAAPLLEGTKRLVDLRVHRGRQRKAPGR